MSVQMILVFIITQSVQKEKNLRLIIDPKNPLRELLIIDEAYSKGTTKYIYHHTPRGPDHECRLSIETIPISFPYMLIEGISCMYGGVYITPIISSKDSVIPSLCTQTERYFETDLHDETVVIIHYSEYASENITFRAECHRYGPFFSRVEHWDSRQKYKENTLSITLPKFEVVTFSKSIINSRLLKLKKIQHINISCDSLIEIIFSDFLRNSCMNLTIFYYPHASNIRGRQYDQETISGHRYFVTEKDFIRSIFIDMRACTLVTAPVWELVLWIHGRPKDGLSRSVIGNFTDSLYLPADITNVGTELVAVPKRSLWLMVHMLRPEDVPAYAIWRVFIHLDYLTAHVSIEVLIDNHHSSSVYEWNNFQSPDGVYITVDKAVNILIDSYTGRHGTHDINIWFMRHFIHDDKLKKTIAGQTPGQSSFSFHNQR